jgi:apolipoprotein D and lipocalin family protein
MSVMWGLVGLCAGALAQTAAPSSPPADSVRPLQSLPALQVTPYLGTWYQVAYFPNTFQKQCVSDSTAQYRARDDGSLEVINRCRMADGRWDEAVGLAVPTGRREGDELKPAQLKVSFLPAVLRWMSVGWGAYWLIQRADDGRYAVISEPSRKYLWVLSRQPQLSAADETAIRSRLLEQGFNLSAWATHPHPAAVSGSPARTSWLDGPSSFSVTVLR